MAVRYQVPAIKRTFDIIELLAGSDSGMTISEIRRALRLPLSSAAVIMYTLDELGYVERDEQSGSYSLSVKMLGVARHALDRISLVSHCHGLLREASRESGLTAHLAVLRDADSMYVDRVASDGLVQISTYIGQRWPAQVSAAGKALLAFLPRRALSQTLRRTTWRKLTAHSVTSRHALEKQLRQFRRLGYAWERNEGEIGVGCVAAPIFGPGHEVVAALSLTGTAQQISRIGISVLAALAQRHAHQMSARLGDQPAPQQP